MIELQTRLPDKMILEGSAWEPVDPPRAGVMIVHGLGEHVGRHRELAEACAERGWLAVGFDLPGHGRSAGPRGHVRSFSALLDAVDATGKAVSTRLPAGHPIALYGHSWGGNIALNWLLQRHRPAVVAAVLSSPWLHLARPPGLWTLAGARLIHRLLPRLGQPNGLDPNDLSRDPAVGRAFLDDPLTHQRITLRTFVESDRAARRALEECDRLNIPTLVLHGDEDRICALSGSRALAECSPHVELRELPGRHELHHDLDGPAIRAKILDWLAIHLEH